MVADPQKIWTTAQDTEFGEPTRAPTVRSLQPVDMGVAYQPIVEARSGRLFAYEALARCRREAFRSPAVLFEQAAAEQACGLLGRMIRDVAFAGVTETALFVNLHPDELSSEWLVRPDDPLGFHDAAVYLEVTETAALSHYELCRSVLKELHLRAGAKLVVDDFGAGHSNLQRLLDLEPAIVKLDLALTRDIHEQPRKQAVVRHMVNLCAELDAEVVAEGVETADELSCVIDLGVHYVQGYLLARPGMPPPAHHWPFGEVTPARRAPFQRPTASAPAKAPPIVPNFPAAPHSAPVIRDKERPAGATSPGPTPADPGPTARPTRPVSRPSRIPTVRARAKDPEKLGRGRY